MLIKRIVLSPFGGIHQREVHFQEGLNVVLGANEAGKSTLVHALFAALFLPSDLKKNEKLFKEYIERFMPHGGGDTIGVTVELKLGDNTYILTRSWGQSRSCRLVLPTGAVITNELTVQDLLNNLLGLGRGTYEGVFFARQEEMTKTVEILRQNKEAANTLGDVLRAVLIQAGGVSIDELSAVITDVKKDLLDNWDSQRDAPKNNRGIDNPYVKNVGWLLAAYYAKEGIKRSLRSARDAETRVEEAYARLKAAREQKKVLIPKKETLENMEKDVYQRASLQPDVDRLFLKEEKLKEINREWPKETERLAQFQEKLNEKHKRHAQLTEELFCARTAHENKIRLERYKIVQPLASELDSLQNELQRLPDVKKADIEWFDKTFGRLSNLEAEIKAMRLVAKMTTASPLNIQFQSALNQKQTVCVAKEADFEGEGHLFIEAKDWTLRLQAGSSDVPSLLSTMGSIQKDIQEKLHELQVIDINQARQIMATRQQLQSKAEQLQAQMAGALHGETLAELAAAAENAADWLTRDPETVLTEQIQTAADVRQTEKQIEEIRGRLQFWEQNYESADAVLDQLVDVRSHVKELQKQLVKLAPLPAEYADTNAYILELKALREKGRQLDEEEYAAKEQLLEAQMLLGEETAEDLTERLQEAEKQFQQLKNRAHALLAVEEEFNRITAQIDQLSFSPYVDAFCRYLAPATGYRYQAAELAGALPSHIVSAEGRQLPVELLSMGTTRGIALALRLAMAEFLLQQHEGFMVMDDPLVDLDPKRKQHAAAMVGEFAQTRQMIITTCDPDTANRLGGNRIDL